MLDLCMRKRQLTLVLNFALLCLPRLMGRMSPGLVLVSAPTIHMPILICTGVGLIVPLSQSYPVNFCSGTKPTGDACQIVQLRLLMAMLMTGYATVLVPILPTLQDMEVTTLLLMVFTRDVCQSVLTTQLSNYSATKLNVFPFVLMAHGATLSQNCAFPTVHRHLPIHTKITLQVRIYVFKIVQILTGSGTTQPGHACQPVLPPNSERQTDSVWQSATMVVSVFPSTTENV